MTVDAFFILCDFVPTFGASKKTFTNMTKLRATVFSALMGIVLLTSLHAKLYAGEGMWLPLLLGQLNEKDMQAMGMKMTAEDIYSVNKGSLKDAIVHFGGFCTGEVISSQGLVLTNHHCGYGQIQSHSTLENNYLQDGFWAKDFAAELPNPGLFVTFIVRIEDVTASALEGVKPTMKENERTSTIDKNLNAIKKAVAKESYQDVLVRPFFHGNQYFLFVTETYNDVRLVGTPPSSIGKFGADTDNWIWPRHTGDFSMFRIYASPDGKPADYSPDNVPFRPRHHLPVSMDGVAVDDFTLVFGFPGRTDEYLPAVAVDQRVNILNPIRINIREKSLGILDKAMRTNPEARIQYAAKQARIANAWKKWVGESQGVAATDGIGRKKELEKEFTQIVAQNEALKARYGQLLPTFERLHTKIQPFAESRDYITEIMNVNVELFRTVNMLKRYETIYINNGIAGLVSRLDEVKMRLEEFYKDYNPAIDEETAAALMNMYYTQLNAEHRAPYANDQLEFAGGNVNVLMKTIYEKSFLTKADVALQILLNNPEGFFRQLSGDYAYQYVQEITNFSNETVFKPYNTIDQEIQALQRDYMAALMEAFPDRTFYPDANSTLRATFGKVQGYTANDTLFEHITYLDGVVAKYVPGDYEFDLPARLLELYEEKEFGPYADTTGQVPVCFIGSNHTTGGNSGSPAIDAYGNLIGLNFDRSWHGTMSDINYDERICRNIMVDVRYILFIVDKFAGATHLVEEMTLVHPKAK